MVTIKKNIYWVGGVDWNIRDFHGYTTEEGSSYNAYLIIDEKITLIDTVKSYLYEEMLSRISEIIDPAKIDNIISLHTEMDHSGALPEIYKVAKNAKIYASPQGVIGLKKHYPELKEILTCEEGSTLNTGKYTFTFHLAQMLHWPDNMAAYLEQEKILFSNDAFGQHIASSVHFDDMYSEGMFFRQAMKYYANIVQCYNERVVAFAKKAVMPHDIEIICPSHGIIIRKYTKEIIAKYIEWATNTVKKKALVVYDSMWESTDKLARQIQRGLEDSGVETSLCDLKYNHISDIMTDVLDSAAIVVGSPTLNNNMLPNVAAFLCYLKGLAPAKRIGMAFGSFGWNGQGHKQVHSALLELKEWDISLEPLGVKYIPTEEELAMAYEKGKSMAALIEKTVK